MVDLVEIETGGQFLVHELLAGRCISKMPQLPLERVVTKVEDRSRREELH